MNMNNFWKFSKKLSVNLLAWSGFSIASGGWLLRNDQPFWRGIGLHFVAWGVIDALIALFGLVSTNRKSRQAASGERGGDEIVAVDQKRLYRLLLINTWLDILYFMGGGWLYLHKGAKDESWRGQGIGVILQSGFLFFFDLWHALKLGRSLK